MISLGFPFYLWYNGTSKYKELKAMSSGVKDIQLIENLQAQLEYLKKTKCFVPPVKSAGIRFRDR